MREREREEGSEREREREREREFCVGAHGGHSHVHLSPEFCHIVSVGSEPAKEIAECSLTASVLPLIRVKRCTVSVD